MLYCAPVMKRWVLLSGALSLLAAHARAESPVRLAEDSPRVRIQLGKGSTLAFGGYAETFYQWNLGRPQNGITEFRAFDNRHNAFTLQAVALDVSFATRHFEVRVVPQAGTGPATYYGASEPIVAGSGFTPRSDAGAWQHLQQAWMAYSPLPERLTFDAGLFLSPIGVESMATHGNHHWSHSVMFFALPFYHLGARVRWVPAPGHALRAGVYNGWNSIGDGNAEKTLGVEYSYSPGRAVTLGVASFTGVERPSSAPEGRAVRQLFDAHVRWRPHPRVELIEWLDTGFEPNELGLSSWFGSTTSARLQILRWLFTAARFTWLREHRAADRAAPMLMPADRIASRSLTVELLPLHGLSLKIEGRRDDADRDIYFTGAVRGLGSADQPYVPNTRAQTTLTVGATGWF